MKRTAHAFHLETNDHATIIFVNTITGLVILDVENCVGS